MLAKFQDNQRLIAMSSINFLNSSFCSLKLCIKDEVMDQMVNNIQLAWLLRTYNSTLEFSKYEFYIKLLGGVTLLRVTPSVTWT